MGNEEEFIFEGNVEEEEEDDPDIILIEEKTRETPAAAISTAEGTGGRGRGREETKNVLEKLTGLIDFVSRQNARLGGLPGNTQNVVGVTNVKLEREQLELEETSSLEGMWAKFNELQSYFWEKIREIERMGVSVEGKRKLEKFKRKINELFWQLQSQLRKWEGEHKDMEGGLGNVRGIITKLEKVISEKVQVEVTEVGINTEELLPLPPIPAAVVKKKLPPPALLPLQNRPTPGKKKRGVIAVPLFTVPPVVPPPPPPVTQHSVITHTQLVNRGGGSVSVSVASSNIQYPQMKPPAAVHEIPKVSRAAFLPPAAPPPPVPVFYQPTISKRVTGCSSIPPTHIHKVIHPALPPVREAAVNEMIEGANVPPGGEEVAPGEGQVPPVEGEVIAGGKEVPSVGKEVTPEEIPPQKQLQEAPAPAAPVEKATEAVQNSSEKQNICGVCGKGFVTLVLLKMHQCLAL